MPMLRAKKKAVGTGPEIPDFLRVQPDEREVKLQKHKAELLDKLKPTQDSVSQVRNLCKVAWHPDHRAARPD